MERDNNIFFIEQINGDFDRKPGARNAHIYARKGFSVLLFFWEGV